MAQALAGKGAKRLIERHVKQFEPEDPHYEEYTDSNGKKKRRKRPLPPGLTKKDAKILRKVRRRAHYLDKGFYICGLRFGWTFFIGIIPGVGDLTDAVLNYKLVVVPSKDADIPEWLLSKMLVNNAISAGIGFVPLVGDVALAVWKANSRNAKLLEEFLRIRGEENIAAGLPDLTPGDPSGVHHPAQSAAADHVRQSGAGAGAGNANASGNTSAAASDAGTGTAAGSAARNKKWWQKKGGAQ